MLARSPSFVFTAGDVDAIVSETGLNKDQVRVWADLFRYRYESEKERKEFLEFDGIDKENATRVMRFYVSCFNVTPEFAKNFVFQKSKGQGVFAINYMEATFNREAESGEFFFEFEDSVLEKKLVKSFQSQGAGQVTTVTFANDNGDSSVNALLRVLNNQKKTADNVTRGTCPKLLLNKVNVKQDQAAKQKELSMKEFDEKTAAALNMKLEDVSGNVKDVKDVVHSCEVKLESQSVEFVEMKQDVKSQGVVMEDIKHGVCNVIPDYQEKITKLEGALDHKTKMCDRIEGQKGRLTMEINKLRWELSESLEEKQQLCADKATLTKKIHELLEQQDMYKSIALLKQMQEETQHTAEILSSTLAEERAAKRPRV